MRYCLNYSGTRFLTTENKNYSISVPDGFLLNTIIPPAGCWISAGSVIISDGASASGTIVLFSENAHKISIYLPDLIYFLGSKNVISHICV